MSKTIKQAAIFPIMWLLYCAVVLIQNPQDRTGQAAAGVLVGAVFMAMLGLAILFCVRGRNSSIVHLLVLFGILVAADQAAKGLLLHFLPTDAHISVFDGWISIRHAPNHSNSVLFNLLGIELPSRLADVLFKVVVLGLVAGLAIWFFKKEKFGDADVKIRVGATLVAAGAICSLIDTILLGYVLDFIAIAPLVSFDFKDLYIQFGVALFILALLEQERKEKATKNEKTPGS